MIKKSNIKKIALEILFGENCDVDKTWQAPFKKTIPCKKCNADMIPMLQVSDDGGVTNNIPEQVTKGREKGLELIWPHDSLIAMVYFCIECGAIDADYNQA